MSLFPSSWDEPYPGPDQQRGGFRHAAAKNARYQGRPDDEATAPAAESRPAHVSTLLAAAESPRQQEITRQIYARLKAGANVDDVTDLIGELSRVAAAQAQRTSFGGNSYSGGA